MRSMKTIGATCYIFVALLAGSKALFHFSLLPVKYSWSTVNFLYDDPQQLTEDKRNGDFNSSNVIILDSDCYKKICLVTTPRLLSGVPATLSTISKEFDCKKQRLLKPFPNWAWQNKSSCDNLISPFRIKIDELQRVWVIDSGVVDAFTENVDHKCPAKLLIFNLKSGKLIRRYVFPAEQRTNLSLPLQVEVQILDQTGDDSYAYIADSTEDRMLVYSYKENSSHVIMNKYFAPESDYEDYSLNGVEFTLDDGLFSLAMDLTKDKMYFHALSSGSQGYVDGKVLRNTNLTEEEQNQLIMAYNYKPKMHTSIQVITKSGILIFPSLEQNALYAWNTEKEFSSSNFELIAANDITLQFVSGMKIIDKDLLVTTSRLQNVIAYGGNEPGKINFRILRGKLKYLLKNV